MEDSYYFGAYWRARRESTDLCAGRAALFLGRLSAMGGEHLKAWYQVESVDGNRERRTPVDASPAAIAAVMERDAEAQEGDAAVRADLGASLQVWADTGPAAALGVSITCGSCSRYLSNACVVRLPETGDMVRSLLDRDGARGLLDCMVECWNPDWAVVAPTSYDPWRSAADDAISGGWMVYVNRYLAAVDGAAAIETIGRGTVIVCTSEKFDLRVPEHVARAHVVEQELYGIGIRA